jgi:RimJ/RimL family protein N-acetyltransferase
MIEIITGWDAALAHWVGQNLETNLGDGCVALGFAEGPELLGAIAYHNFQWPNIEGSIFAVSPRWCNRRTLFACFYHPFIVMKCRRFGANAAVTNQPSRAFLQRLGFQLEGTARQAMRHGGQVCDAAIYGMLAHECRWLGQLRPEVPAAAD